MSGSTNDRAKSTETWLKVVTKAVRPPRQLSVSHCDVSRQALAAGLFGENRRLASGRSRRELRNFKKLVAELSS